MPKPMVNMYNPDVVSRPGETLEEVLDDRGMTQAELAERMGRPKKTINEIIQGKAAITADTALQLEYVLDVPASFWLQREQQYREALARHQEEGQLAAHLPWLDSLPVKWMVQHDWIAAHADPLDMLREVLRFFGIATPAQRYFVTAVLRRSTAFESDEEALRVWLRQGERLAHAIACAPFDAGGFRAVLTQARALTREPFATARADLVQRCATAGVAVVIVPELPRTRVCGATRWLASEKALIQLSLRYKTDDQFWFTFFHEAGHVLLHGKRASFLDEEGAEADPREAEANRFAADLLVPPADLQRFHAQRGRSYLSAELIEGFAAELGVASGIIVGRLQHDDVLPKTHLNKLKQRLVP